MTEFTKGEVSALKIMVDFVANHYKEDLIGAFLNTGAAQCLEGDTSSVIALVNKLEQNEPKIVITIEEKKE